MYIAFNIANLNDMPLSLCATLIFAMSWERACRLSTSTIRDRDYRQLL